MPLAAWKSPELSTPEGILRSQVDCTYLQFSEATAAGDYYISHNHPETEGQVSTAGNAEDCAAPQANCPKEDGDAAVEAALCGYTGQQKGTGSDCCG